MPPEEIPKIEAFDPAEEVGMLTRLFVPFRKAGPWMQFASTFSDLAEKRYMTREHCYLYLGRKVREAQMARERQKHAFGRLYNSFSGSRFDTLDVSGAVLRVTLKSLSQDLPRGLSNDGVYRLRLDIAEELSAGLTELMRSEGLIT